MASFKAICRAKPLKTTWPEFRDDDVVGEVQRQLDVLLHQHDRKPLALEPGNSAPDIGDDLRRQPFGRLIHQQQARIAHQRPADRQHLLLAAGKQAGELMTPLGEPRKHLQTPCRGPTCVLPATIGLRAATLRFSRTVRLRNTRRPCGTSATPQAAIASGGEARDIGAEHLHAARARGQAGRRRR